ncbi:MAG: HK97 gp10 family phage protein [Bilophila wadsworthia]
MSNDVVVDIPIEDIRAGVRAEIDSDLGGIAAQVFEKAKSSTAFRDKTGRLRQSIWIYRSKYKDGGYVVYVKAPHSHLVEFGHEQIAKDGKTVLISSRKAFPAQGPQRRPAKGGYDASRHDGGPALWQAPLILKSSCCGRCGRMRACPRWLGTRFSRW